MGICRLRLNNNSILEIEIRDGEYVIDCGANVGNITSIFENAGANVIAFEPNKHAFEILQTRFVYNKKVRCFKKGVVGKNPGKRKLFMHKNNYIDEIVYSTGSSIIESKNNVNKNNYEEVEMVRLSSFIKKFNKDIKVLKIDIEGAEIELLNDLMDSGVARKIPYIFVETHEKKIPTLQKEKEALRNRVKNEGYTNINLNWI